MKKICYSAWDFVEEAGHRMIENFWWVAVFGMVLMVALRIDQ